MRILTLFLAIITMMHVLPLKAYAGNIVAVVNEDAITSTDLNSRMKLIIVSSGLKDTMDIRKKLRPQVINNLIDEQLMLQEAKRLDVNIERAEIDQGFSTIAAQNKLEPQVFKNMVQSSGIDILTMERQIEAQIAWTKVIQQEVQPRLFVSENDIDDYLARMESNKGRTEYLVSEIFLPVADNKEAQKTLQLAQRVVADIRQNNVPFAKIAQQLSKAPGAQNGGSLGWVHQDQLATEISKALTQLNNGQVTDPIQAPDGYHIVQLRNKRTVADQTLPSRDEVHNMLAMQRMERMQKRHLLDLKSAAFIEDRQASGS